MHPICPSPYHGLPRLWAGLRGLRRL